MSQRGPRAAPIGVALAGAGMISWYHLVAWRNLGPRIRLVAVCDPDLEHGRRRAWNKRCRFNNRV